MIIGSFRVTLNENYKHMKRYILFVFLFFAIPALAQDNNYAAMMRDPNASFHDIKQAFENFWEGKEVKKGKGYKQFRRWEYFMSRRVNAEGFLPLDIIAAELENVQAMKKNQQKGMASGNWVPLGPTLVPNNGLSYPAAGIGRVNCIRFDPQNPNIIWVGTPGGGLWKSGNGGTSWTSNTDQFTNLGISDIAIHPANSQIMYIATGDADAGDTYSYGVLKSTDAGQTFSATGLSFAVNNGVRIARILIDPVNPDILIAATNSGIYRTANAGTSWSNVQSGNFYDLEFKPGDNQTVYASTYLNGGTTGSVYRSVNNGSTWARITNGLPVSDVIRIALAVSEQNPNVVYALAGNATDYGYKGLYKSTNSGTSFTLVHSSPNILTHEEDGTGSGGQAWYDLAIAASPLDANTVYVGGVNVWKSTNGGSTFTITGHWYAGGAGNIPFIHADQHALEFQPGTSTIFSGNDGGIRKSTNAGGLWNDLSNGLQIMQFYRLSNSHTNANIIAAGAQDNGTHRMNNGSWAVVYGGDGMECIIDYTNANIMYATYQYGNLARSTNGGASFSSIVPAGAGDGAWVTPYVIHPISNTTLYAGYNDIYKTTNSGSGWTMVYSNPNGSTKFESMAISKSNPDVVYAGTYNKLYKTTNAGTNWTDVTSGLPVSSTSITYIAISATDANKVWVTFSGYNAANKVFYSANGGSSWTNVSSGLPNLPVNCIVYEDGSADALYAGTDVGVYYKDNSQAWTMFASGLPNVIVNELEIHYPTSKIRAATYGRGIWESDLYVAVVAPVADFTASATSITESSAISFTDQSMNIPTAWSWSFPGATPSSSTMPNPTNILYTVPGVYDVILTVTNAAGNDTETKNGYITVNANTLAPVANFISSDTMITKGQSVQYDDLSLHLPNTWSWEFDGGTPATSNAQQVTVTYHTPGIYNVKLIVSNANGSDSVFKQNTIRVMDAGISNCPKWLTKASGFTIPSRGINSIQCLSPNVAWALAYDGSGGGANIRQYTKTTDGGETWAQGTVTGAGILSSMEIASLSAIDADTAYAALYPSTGTSQGVFKTTNGGASWTEINTTAYGNLSFLNLVHFFNATDGVTMGDPESGYFEIYVTSNAGNTWTRVPSPNIPAPIAADEYGTIGYYDAVGNTIWFSTTKGRIYKSIDKGLNWTVASTPLGTGVYIPEISFKDQNNGLAAAVYVSGNTNAGLLRTTDGGNTWILIHAGQTAGIGLRSGLAYVPGTAGTYYMTGATAGNTGSAYSIDDGTSWTAIDNIQHTAIGFYDAALGFSGGFNTSAAVGGIHKMQSITTIASISASDPVDFCPGETVQLSAMTVSGASYQWKRNNTNIPSANNSTYAVQTSGDYTVEITSNGCPAISNVITLTQKAQAPKPNVSINGFLNICVGDSVILTSDAPADNQWFLNGAAISGATSPMYVAKAGGSYTVQVSHVSGCVNTSDVITVVMHLYPVTPTITADSNTFCEGAGLFLQSSATVNNQWYKDHALIVGATDAAYYANEAGTYYVEVSNNGYCAVLSDSIVLTSIPSPAKAAVLLIGAGAFCAGDSAILVSDISADIQWIKDGQPVADANKDTLIVKETGNYQVQTNSGNGCAALSDPQNIIVHSLPLEPVIFQNANTLSTLVAGACQWYLNDTLLAGANAQSYEITRSGIYRVEVENINGCKNISAPFHAIYVGLDFSYSDYSFKVYPNPLKTGSAIVEININTDYPNVQLEVLDILGKKVHSVMRTDRLEKGLHRYQLPELSPGTYFIKWKSDSFSESLRLVVL